MDTDNSNSSSPDEVASSRAYAIYRMSLIGYCLLFFCIATLLYVGFGFPNIIARYQEADSEGKNLAAMALAASIVILLNNLVIAFGAVQMIRARSFIFCIICLSLAMVPTLGVCFFLGIPLGIWGLVTITIPEVRRGFC